MKMSTLDTILAARATKTGIAVITRLSDGAQCVFDGLSINGDLFLSQSVFDEIRDRMRDDRSGPIDNGTLFVHVHNPTLRLIIVGAVHIAQALVPMAGIAGLDVTVVDPRGSFATEDRFPGVRLMDEWPDEALEALKPDHRTAIVTLTHDPKLDDPALEVALRGPAFYIASLGGQRTHSRRLERLRESGFAESELRRIHGPAGLDIGAISPSEIAISIMAEITAVRHDRMVKARAG